MEYSVREKQIRFAGLLGLGTNFLLFLLKFFVGTIAGSVSVIADSFNNLSDMGASGVGLVGLRMAEKPSDAEHPFGHGRVEYVSGLVVSFLILFLGVELFMDAVEKILHPGAVHFSMVSLLLLIFAVPVKLGLGLYTQKVGKKTNSPAMQAAGKDSLNDVLVTSATILSALLSQHTVFPVDGVIGLLVSGFVVFAGIGILKDTVGPLLGQAPPKPLVKAIEQRVLDCDGVIGIHDLIVHNYGPNRFMASAHAEVRADCDILKMHDAIDLAERRVMEELGVAITIHLDPLETDDALTNTLREKVCDIVATIDPAFSIHDFRVVSGDTHTNLIFDVVLPGTWRGKPGDLKAEIDARLSRHNPTYFTVITFERNFS